MITDKDVKQHINKRIDQVKALRIACLDKSLTDTERLESWQNTYDLCMLLAEEAVLLGIGKGTSFASELADRAQKQIVILRAQLAEQEDEKMSEEELEELRIELANI